MCEHNVTNTLCKTLSKCLDICLQTSFVIFFFFTFSPEMFPFWLRRISNKVFFSLNYQSKYFSYVSQQIAAVWSLVVFPFFENQSELRKQKLYGIFRQKLSAGNTIFILPFLSGKPDNWNLQNSQSSWLNWVSRPEFNMNGPV